MPDEAYESLRAAREAVLVVGEDGVVVFANRAAREVLRRPEAEIVGLPFIDPALGFRTLDDEPLTEEESPVGRAMRRGGSVRTARYLERHADGTVAILSLAARPLTSPEGGPGVSVRIAETARLLPETARPAAETTVASVDPPSTDWEASARRLQGLAQMSGLLFGAITPAQAFGQIAEYATIFFDLPGCVVLRAEGDSGALAPFGSSGLGESLAQERLLLSDTRRLGFDRPVPLIVNELNAVAHLSFFARLRELSYTSVVCLGLVTEARTHGVLMLLGHRPFAFTEEQLVFLRLFGTMAAATVATAERQENDRLLAETVQQALLASPTEVPGIRHAALYRSATRGAAVGGDFYDVYALPDGRLGILIGDISGKGLDASLLMAVVKNSMKAYAYGSARPAEIMAMCNRLLLDSSPPLGFATAFLGFYDPRSGRLDYCGAGHPPPILLRRHGSMEMLQPHSTVLGMLSDARYRDDFTQLAQGDLLFLYTDGVTEARRGDELLGEERLFEFVRAGAGEDPARLVEGVFAEVGEFSGGEFRDDVAILVVKPEGVA